MLHQTLKSNTYNQSHWNVTVKKFLNVNFCRCQFWDLRAGTAKIRPNPTTSRWLSYHIEEKRAVVKVGVFLGVFYLAGALDDTATFYLYAGIVDGRQLELLHVPYTPRQYLREMNFNADDDNHKSFKSFLDQNRLYQLMLSIVSILLLFWTTLLPWSGSSDMSSNAKLL